MHTAVQEGLAKRGQIFLGNGSDDPSPEVVSEPGLDADGVDFYVLSLKKGKSISIDGQLFRYDFDDEDAPEKAWTTYTYLIALPDVSEQLPARWLLTRTGRPTAQRINQVLALASGQKPDYACAFNLKTKGTKNAKGSFFVPVVSPIETTDEGLKVAEALHDKFVNSVASPAAP
jgi:hypothetical protein